MRVLSPFDLYNLYIRTVHDFTSAIVLTIKIDYTYNVCHHRMFQTLNYFIIFTAHLSYPIRALPYSTFPESSPPSFTYLKKRQISYHHSMQQCLALTSKLGILSHYYSYSCGKAAISRQHFLVLIIGPFLLCFF